MLLFGNSGHADIPLDSPGSGLFGLLLTMLGQTVGFPVPRGGAGELTRALVRRLESNGGSVRCGREVARVVVEDGRAVGVMTADGERCEAGRAVVADVAPCLSSSGSSTRGTYRRGSSVGCAPSTSTPGR